MSETQVALDGAGYRKSIGADNDEVTGAGLEPNAPMPEAGQTIGKYELIRSLGRGGMGEVFLARDTRLGRRVAVKFVDVTDEASGRRVLDEARATAMCNHENIVVIHEAEVVQGWHYLVLEYLQGQPLTGLLADGRALPPGRAVELLLPVVKALVRAHEEGIVHRDLKPDNIFLTESGTVKVLDFGIATAVTRREARDAIGTRSFMSPEQWLQRGVDQRSDLFSFGLVLFRALAGRHPLKDDKRDEIATTSVLEVPMPKLASMASGVPQGLCEVVDRCLEKSVEKRFQSARELLEALAPFEVGRVSRELKVGESPYTGLSTFQESDSGRFFGRTRETAAFIARLRAQPLMAVVGSSGAGKSSFVRAGVLPALKRSGEGWQSLTLRPTRRPLEALVDALLDRDETTGPQDRGALVELLQREPGHAGGLLRNWARKRNGRVLVFVDQFEELFTQGATPEHRQLFITALRGMADDAASPVRVVLSVRADFLDRLGEDPQFLAELGTGLFFLGAPGRDGLREALVHPAEMAGFRFESESILDDMLGHLQATPGALPLLQFTASKLWDSRDETRRLLTVEKYQALGGISGALASHADRVIQELAPAGQALARQVLPSLVTADRTRGTVPLDQLRDLTKDPGAVEALVDQLVRARLLVVQTLEGVAAVELVHESLIARWPLLQRWLDEGREDQAFREQLRSAAKQWDARGRAKGLLWQGEMMEEARLWRARRKVQLPDRETAYLEAVLAEGARAVRRRRLAVGAIISALSLTVAVGAVALVQVRAAEALAVNAADRATREATRATQEAERARTAEAQVTAQFEALKREQEAKAQAEAALEQGRGDLRVANKNLQEALEKARVESEHAKDAAARANELSASLQKTNATLQTLLAEERKRAERLEKERKKITTELK